MYELNKRAVQLPRSLLWDLWERITRGRNGVPGAVLGWDCPRGAFCLPWCAHACPMRVGSWVVGERLMGCLRDIRALVGDKSLVYSGFLLQVMTQCIVGDSFWVF